ncbi:triose-phosphate isomerase [Aestuariivirga litoralis]|uniref:triose-phosphate isomerase n=1 Tax=Aestuariivirga litoralis TaxID=2650924 RepID=UPI0018C79B75|nr:triose-phosphate isomerase [Aestuariivirga litoralis]
MARKIPWIGTSWKMNKLRADAQSFARTLAASPVAQATNCQPFVIPPFPYIAEVAQLLSGTKVKIGAQNMHWADQGAWTGEVSAPMVKDCGATLVELGHSERRAHFGETDETVALKTQAALKHGLTALVCIGDTKAEFDSGQTAEALERQVRGLLKYVSKEASGKVIIAYEPVWSIGEGGTPATPEFANEQHIKIAALVQKLTGGSLPILYGGSVNPQNCVALANQSHIDGLFIGRSAWDAASYISIVQSVTESLS